VSSADPGSILLLVAGGGFLLAFVFGLVGAKTNFCTMGALSDAFNMGDWARLRMWLLAIAVAIAGAWALQRAGLADLDQSIYRASRLTWLSHLTGGFLFGVGMVLGSGCGSKTLIRIGGGNLKSVVVAVFLALSADMTLRGVLATLRAGVLDRVAVDLGTPQDLAHLLGRALSADTSVLSAACALAIAAVLLVAVLARAEGRRTDVLIGGVTVGLVVVGGWFVTGHLGFVAEHPDTLQPACIGTNTGRPESLTFVAPQAYTLELLQFWTDKSKVVTFGIASVAGVIAGSFAQAMLSGSFRLESFRSTEDLLHHIAGGLLMGFGGVTALGCTIGQGITGLSTLAVGSFVTTAAIVVGAASGFRYLSWRA
jgi:uncharacterized membrane protein YedE/YeeE